MGLRNHSSRIKHKGLGLIVSNPLIFMARPKRFELLTPWFVARYSIQLSYGRKNLLAVAETEGFEPSIRVLARMLP